MINTNPENPLGEDQVEYFGSPDSVFRPTENNKSTNNNN